MKRLPAVLGLLLLGAGCSGGGNPISVADTGRPPDSRTQPTDVLAPDATETASTPDAAADDLFELALPDVAEADTFEPGCAPGEGCFLDECTSNEECLSGWCVDHLGEGVCSQACQAECPQGWECRQVAGTAPDVVYICVSRHANLCRPCATAADCQSTGAEDVCVAYGDGASFCGGTCGSDDDCPWGFTCADGETVAGVPTKQCVADAGECPCTARSVELALWTPCVATNEAGTCTGKRICTADGLSACDAAVPAAETCDGIDNDCNGETDEATCDDGNECTLDQCLGAEGCLHEPLNEGECKDGDSCTVGDHCEEGVCVGSLISCDDSNPCTDDTCSGLGGCVYEFNQADCDDADPCTVADECTQGTCQGVAVNCQCATDADCAALEDGDVCNGTLACDTESLPYQCRVIPESIITCPEPGAGPDAICLAAACDPVTGECSLVPAHEGFACDDGDSCTVGDHCEEGICTGGVAPLCDDSNPCTTDACDPGQGCVHAPAAGPCDDGNECTLDDTCLGGVCTSLTPLDCDDSNPCTTDTCAPATGCQHKLNAAPCNDGNVCTTDDHCHLGECIGGGTLTCDDSNPCTDDSCAPKSGCKFTPNNAPCDDGSVCTQDDVCKGGWCTPGATISCGDENPCTDDACDPQAGCVFPPNAAPCDDGDTCTVNDACSQGACAPGAPLNCDDANPCTDDACDPAGGCVHTPNSLPCNDADACTMNEFCHQASCGGGIAVVCDDENLCTDDACDPGTGCVFAPNAAGCDDADACTLGDTCAEGTCQPGSETPDCDDSNECTIDSCDPATGCIHPPVADDTPCAPDGTCQQGACVPDITFGCADVKNAQPDAPSGIYEIDPDGEGGDAPIQVWCEMDQDSGGWTLVMNVNTADGHMAYLPDSLWTTHNESGSFANRWTHDYKSKAAVALEATQLLLIVRNHNAGEGGAIQGWRSWNLAGPRTFQSFFDVGMGDAYANATGGCNNGQSGDGRQQTAGVLSAGQAATWDTFTNQADEVYSNSYYGGCGAVQDGYRLSSHYRWANNSNVGLGLQMDGANDQSYNLEAGALMKKDTFKDPQRQCCGSCSSCSINADGAGSKSAIGSDHQSCHCNVGVTYRYEWYVR